MKQWIRDIRLIIGQDTSGTDALDFSQFRIKFEIKQAMVDIPASAEIYIYNVSKNTVDKFKGLGQQVLLEAGYVGGRGVIFKGTVRQLFRSRENQTDTYLCVLGQSSDLSYNYAVSNGTLAAGYTQEDILKKVKQDMQSKGDVDAIETPNLSDYKSPRGRVFYGMSRDYISGVATSNNMYVGYVDNKVSLYEEDSAVNEAHAVVMNSTTGMIGMPQLTISGIYVTCLLRPDIKPNTQIYINESSIKREVFSVAYAAEGNNIQIDESHISQDGYYKAVAVNHYGDTRQNEWYSQICCVGINATTPITGPSLTSV